MKTVSLTVVGSNSIAFTADQPTNKSNYNIWSQKNRYEESHTASAYNFIRIVALTKRTHHFRILPLNC